MTAGTYLSPLLDLTDSATFTSGFIANFASGGLLENAEEALVAGFDSGKAYFNIHSQVFPGGEIRGFLQQVPEPGTLVLLGVSLAGVAAVRRRKQ